jgi:hypothetical protein
MTSARQAALGDRRQTSSTYPIVKDLRISSGVFLRFRVQRLSMANILIFFSL